MTFCPKCGAHHDPQFPCVDRAGEMLRDMGVEKHSKMSKQEFKKLEKATDTSMFKVFIIIVTGFILLMVFVFLLQRYI
jgi:hypothetical protein